MGESFAREMEARGNRQSFHSLRFLLKRMDMLTFFLVILDLLKAVVVMGCYWCTFRYRSSKNSNIPMIYH